MAMTKEHIKAALVSHIKQYGRCPNWRSLDVVSMEDYHTGVAAFDELLADGIIEHYVRISPKGKKITLIRLK